MQRAAHVFLACRASSCLRHLTRDTTMATASTIDAMAKTVMASFGQEESKAVAWTSALATSLVTQQRQLAELLKADKAKRVKR